MKKYSVPKVEMQVLESVTVLCASTPSSAPSIQVSSDPVNNIYSD